MSAGILTSGSLCPGINNAIRHIVVAEKCAGRTVYGYMDGFKGLNEDRKYRLDLVDLYDESGSILRMSREPLDLEKARPQLETLDHLWCIGGHGTMAAAKVVAADENLDINVIGIAKSINNDVPKIRETLGFQSAVNELSAIVNRAHTLALTESTIVFIEVPGERNGTLVRTAGMASLSKCQVVISPESYEDYLYDVETFYRADGYCVVLVSEYCEYSYIKKHIEKRHGIKTVTLKPGMLINTAPTSAYDNILSTRMITEAVEYAKTRKNFIKGATNVVDLV
jgi:6-phosphofructokinase